MIVLLNLVVIEQFFRFHFYSLVLSQCYFHWQQVMVEFHGHQLIDFVWAYWKDYYCQRPWLASVTQQQNHQQRTIYRKTIISRQLPRRLVIAGCYVGSAWAYFSAWILYSGQFQQLAKSLGYNGTIWPLVFYVNGIISIAILYLFRDEFNIQLDNIFFESSSTESIMRKANNIWEDTLSIANETISSESGRALLSAQVGQGALLYSIASYSPLYLERVMQTQSTATNLMETSATAVTAAASIAASSLIGPQVTQALVGVSIGTAADKLSSNIGTRTTRRALQLISGVIPALILWYLSTSGDNSNLELSPALLFGIAQTVSALSLGAVSVSQLDIASTDKAGSVYAVGNIAAAVSGSLMVSIFGHLLDNASSTGMSNGNEFSLPFQLVALLSATGSVIYAFTVETELEIGSNQTDQSVHPQ